MSLPCIKFPDVYAVNSVAIAKQRRESEVMVNIDDYKCSVFVRKELSRGAVAINEKISQRMYEEGKEKMKGRVVGRKVSPYPWIVT